MDRSLKDLLKEAKPWLIGLIISSLLAFISWHLYGKEFQLLYVFMSVVLGTGIVFGIYLIFIIIHLITIKSGIVTAQIERKTKQMDKTDFEKNKDYYREILKINSPLIIGYLDNFELDKNKLIAELLYLKKKKCIDIKNGNIEKVDDLDNYDLNELDIEMIKNLKEGKFKLNQMINLREMVASKAAKNDLVKIIKSVSNNKKKWKIIFIIMSIILGVVVSHLIIPSDIAIQNYKNGHISLLYLVGSRIIIYFFFSWISSLVLYIITEVFKNTYLKTRGALYKRTSKGKELNQKLEGLKNYLKDYSLMDEREAKELELWDDYLIYSVMFGQNKKIVEEYEKYIELIE